MREREREREREGVIQREISLNNSKLSQLAQDISKHFNNSAYNMIIYKTEIRCIISIFYSAVLCIIIQVAFGHFDEMFYGTVCHVCHTQTSDVKVHLRTQHI